MKRTRKQKAQELVRLVTNGPSLFGIGGTQFTPREAEEQTRLWLSSWVEPLVKELVPELRKKQERA